MAIKKKTKKRSKTKTTKTTKNKKRVVKRKSNRRRRIKKGKKLVKKEKPKKARKARKAKPKKVKKRIPRRKKAVSKRKKRKTKLHKEILIGRVTHYFDNIKVAAISLLKTLKQGDEIHFIGGESTDFKQKVSSLEINHRKVKRAKKGTEVGLKVNKKVREGYRVYR